MGEKRLKHGVCPFCGRCCSLTYHHLVPKKLHRRDYFKKNFTRDELNAGVDICRLCHNGVHALYTEMELGKQFPSVKALKSDPQLKRHFTWVSKQKVVNPRS